MKKIFLFVAILLMISLTACDPSGYYFNCDELKEEVIAVELINYDNIEAKIVKNKSEVLPFDFDKAETIETLEIEQIDQFLNDLSKIYFHVSDNLTKYYNSAAGISIRVTSSNGNFIVICANNNFVTQFDAEGGVKELMLRFTSTQDFVNLVNKYFTMQTEH